MRRVNPKHPTHGTRIARRRAAFPRCHRSPTAGIAVILALALLPATQFVGTGIAAAQENFIPPEMAGFKPKREGVFDFDAARDGEVDTFGRDFGNPFGDRLIQFSALIGSGGMWAIFVDKTDNEDGFSTLDGDYLLRDSDCDGKFDERLPLDSPLIVPSCFEE